jgi:hypothetical protein
MQTLAYLLPVLSKAIQNAEKEFVALQQQGKAHEAGTLQALVVVPSRELAMQIVRVAQGLLPHDARATIQQCIGGANPNRQVHLVYMLHHSPLSKCQKYAATMHVLLLIYLCAGVAAHNISSIPGTTVLQLISKCLKLLDACIWQGQLARLLQCWSEVKKTQPPLACCLYGLMVISRPGQQKT